MNPSTFSSEREAVLLLGKLVGAKEILGQISQSFSVIELEKTTRDEFIHDCQTRYNHVSVICCTFEAIKLVGKFDKELVSHFPQSLRFICSKGAGYDAIDVNACKERGIRVSNTPGAVDAATADVAVTLILNTCRNVSRYEQNLRKGLFDKGVPFGTDIEGKKLGIIGMGGIGKAIAKRMRGFDVDIQYHNRNRLERDIELACGGVNYVTLDELLTTSDIISVNVPLNRETRHLIGKKQFERMKKGVIVINTARGAVIDESAMVEALDSGKVLAVGLDVYENEPEIHSGLLKHKRSTLLPHIGTSTTETDEKLDRLALENVREALEKKTLLTPVPEHKHGFN